MSARVQGAPSVSREHKVEVRPAPGLRVTVAVEGRTVADSSRAVLLQETGCPDRYYLPRDDVRMELLEPSDRTSHCPYKGDAVYWSVRAGDRLIEDACWSYPEPLAQRCDIGGHLAFYDEKVDQTVVEE